MIEIKVLGPGCANCQDLERRVKQALQELNIKANVTKVSDYAEMGKYIMMTPGLVINEKVMHSGKPLPKTEKIKEWLKDADKTAGAPKENIQKGKGGCCCGGDCG